MTYLHTALLFYSLSLLSMRAGDSLNINRILDCISHIETGARLYNTTITYYDKQTGKNGELSRYQILPTVWAAYYHGTKNAYLIPAISSKVASSILLDRIALYKHLYARDPSIKEIYILWNAPAYCLSIHMRKLPKVVKLRAINFSNIYYATNNKK